MMLYDYILQDIKKYESNKADVNNIVLFCDPEQEFSSFIQWIETNSQSINILKFDGSLLELLQKLHQWIFVDDVKATSLLVYLPKLSKSLLENTPLLQFAELSGRKSIIDTSMITYFSKFTKISGGHNQKEMKEMLKSLSNPTLEQLNEKLKTLRRKEDSFYYKKLIASSLKSSFNAELCSGSLSPKINEDSVFWRDFLENKFGFPKNEIFLNNAFEEDLVAETIAWCIYCQYVNMQSKSIFEYQSLQSIKPLPKDIEFETIDSLISFAKEKSSTYYYQIANKLGTLLQPDLSQVKDKLKYTLLFSFEETWLWETLAVGLTNNSDNYPSLEELDATLSLITKNSPSANQFKLEWTLLRRFSTLFSLLKRTDTQQILEVNSIDEAMTLYAENFQEIDREHRSIEQNRIILEKRQTEERWNDLHSIYKTLQTAHWTWQEDLNVHYQEICARFNQYLPGKNHQLRNIYPLHVKPIPQSVAYILVDALRYEMGKELASLLQDIFQKTSSVNIEPAMSEIPSNTNIGMNALGFAVLNNNLLRPIISNTKSDFKGFSNINDIKITNPASRSKSFDTTSKLFDTGSYSNGNNPLFVGSNNVLDLETLSEDSIYLIQFGDIDKLGDKIGSDLSYFNNILGKLVETIIFLQNKGMQNFVITSDHGFYLRTNKQSHNPNINQKLHRRHFLFPQKIQDEKLIALSFSDVGYVESERYLHFPRNMDTFTRTEQATSQTFVHGGLSLQERVIPVITFNIAKTQKSSDQSYNFNSVKITHNNGSQFRLTGNIQFSRDFFILDESTPIQLLLRIYSKQTKEMLNFTILPNDGYKEIGCILQSSTKDFTIDVPIHIYDAMVDQTYILSMINLYTGEEKTIPFKI